MKEYFLHDGQNQSGPFSSEELKGKNITRDTHIWKEGISDWVKASEIPELTDLFTNTPPSFKKSQTILPPQMEVKYNAESNEKTAYSKTVKAGTWIGRNPKFSILILVSIFLTGFAIYNASSSNYNSPYTFDKTPEELRMELKIKEQQSPEEYLTDNITMRGNLIGEKVFEGTVSNIASTAIFKDIVIEVSYLSKTESIINKEKFIVYEVINPQQTIRIKKIKTFAPSGTDAFSAKIISAIPVE